MRAATARLDELWEEDLEHFVRASKKHEGVCYELKPRYNFPTASQLPPVNELVGGYEIMYLAGHMEGHMAGDYVIDSTAKGTVVLRVCKNDGLLKGALHSDFVEPKDYEKINPRFSFVQKDHHSDDEKNNDGGRIEAVINPDSMFARQFDDAELNRMLCIIRVISHPIDIPWRPSHHGGEFAEERLARLVDRQDYERSWIHSHLGLPDACGKIVHDYWQMLPSPTFSLMKGDLLLCTDLSDTAESYFVARRV